MTRHRTSLNTPMTNTSFPDEVIKTLKERDSLGGVHSIRISKGIGEITADHIRLLREVKWVQRAVLLIDVRQAGVDAAKSLIDAVFQEDSSHEEKVSIEVR